MLKVRLGQADISAASQAERADTLRRSALDPSPFVVPGAPGFRLLLTTSGLQGFSSAPVQMFGDLAKSRMMDGLVHGAVIAFLFGFAGFAARLGLNRAPALAALIAYGIGSLALIGAAIDDGFIVPGFSAPRCRCCATTGSRGRRASSG